MNEDTLRENTLRFEVIPFKNCKERIRKTKKCEEFKKNKAIRWFSVFKDYILIGYKGKGELIFD